MQKKAHSRKWKRSAGNQNRKLVFFLYNRFYNPIKPFFIISVILIKNILTLASSLQVRRVLFVPTV